MNLVETSIRLSRGTLERLRLLAHLRSIETGENVTWNGLVRECVERYLLADGQNSLDESTDVGG